MFITLIDEGLQQRITDSTDLDGNAAEALKLLLDTRPTSMTAGLDDWTIDKSDGRNILFYKGKNYIPRNIELRRDIVRSFHDHETAGHPGELGTYNAIRQHYWWPGLRTFVKTTFKDVASVNNLKLIVHPLDPPTCPLRERNRQDHSRTVLWT